MTVNRNIFWFTVYQALMSAFISVPVIVLFWQENGLNYTEIMILQAIFSVGILLFEVPTGAFADLVSRKLSLVIAAFGSAFAVLVYSVGTNFLHFVVAETIFAASITFSTGADSAFLFDSLKGEKREDAFKKILGRSISVSLALAAIATTLGGVIGRYNLRMTLSLQIPIFLLAGLAALFLIEPKRFGNRSEKESYLRHILESFKIITRNNEIKWLVVFGGICLTASPLALWFYQPYLKLTGLDILYFGLVFAFYNIFASIFARYADRIERFLGKKISLYVVSGSIVAGFFLMGYLVLAWGFLFGVLFQVVRGFSKTILDDYLNQLVSSEKRATILSFQGLVGKLFFAAFAPIIGFFADAYSLQTALKISGFSFLIFIVPVVLLINRYDKVKKGKNEAA